MRSSKIIRKEDEVGILEFKPERVDLSKAQKVESFSSQQQIEEAVPFEIDPIVSKQIGLQETESRKVALDIEKKSLEKLESIKEQAYKEAYELGLQEGHDKAYEDNRNEIHTRLERLEKLLESLSVMKENLVSSNESKLVDLVYYIARSLALVQIEENRESVIHVIQNVMGGLQTNETTKVKVSKEDYQYILELCDKSQRHREEFSNLKFIENPEVESGGCIFETNHGLVDATLEERFKKVESLLNQTKPKVKAG